MCKDNSTHVEDDDENPTTTTKEEKEEQNNEEEATLWYLAIGSMMLPQSCEHRHFYPVESIPGELMNFRLHFFGPMGYAEAIPSKGDSLHGVAHRVTTSQMLELDKVEIGYTRTDGLARLYKNNEMVNVTVYCRPERTKPDEDLPPQERYIEILIAGAKYHGVDTTYINFLRNHNVQKRTPVHEYQSLGDPPDNSIHYTEIPKPSDGNKLYFTLNGKVIEFSFPHNNRHGNFFQYFHTKYGPHIEIGMSKVAYDLKYGILNNVNDLSDEHSQYIEDSHVRFLQKYNELQFCKVIGTFIYPDRIE